MERKKTNTNWLNGIKAIANYAGAGKTKIASLISTGKLIGVSKWSGTWVIRKIDLESNLKYGTSFRRLNRQQKDDIREGLLEGGS